VQACGSAPTLSSPNRARTPSCARCELRRRREGAAAREFGLKEVVNRATGCPASWGTARRSRGARRHHAGGGERQPGAGAGRERHRQGAGRPQHSPAVAAHRAAVRSVNWRRAADSLLESELFGTRRALQRRRHLAHRACRGATGGTLFWTRSARCRRHAGAGCSACWTSGEVRRSVRSGLPRGRGGWWRPRQDLSASRRRPLPRDLF